MRIRIIPLLLVLLLVAGGTAAYAESGSKGGKKGVVVLHSTEIAATYITADGTVLTEDDLAESDLPSAGDRFLLVDAVYADEARTDAVGRNDIECVVTQFTGTTEEDFAQHLLCHGVLTLDGAGTLAWQGAVSFSAMDEPDPDAPFATVAVTGGTGDYLGASGQVKLFDTSTDETETHNRYEVKLVAGRR